MRGLVVRMLLTVGLLAAMPSVARAGLVDITLVPIEFDTFQLTLRTDPGIQLVQVPIQFHGVPGATFTVPSPNSTNADPVVTAALQFPFNDSLVVVVAPPQVVGEFISTGGMAVLLGTLHDAPNLYSFDCRDCALLLYAGVYDDNLGDITDQTEYLLVEEPPLVALLAVGAAFSLAALRVRA